ncbi:hypothetical protein Msi02_14760 [Microbispora siamensis]|uniref:Uncharacterized protein n=1 Tax=Microbispora siamensis TaxID=564413 RepID=A0ABQ4GGY7_9ACTN|nr:hypothetical protein Msi02_14760 [Microbispora siamensis]
MSSISATSAVRKASTSRNVSTARCLAGRSWSGPEAVIRYSAALPGSWARSTTALATCSAVRMGCIPSARVPGATPWRAAYAATAAEPRAVAGVSCGYSATSRMPSPARLDSSAAYRLM